MLEKVDAMRDRQPSPHLRTALLTALALLLASSLASAGEPPKDLLQRIAERGSLFEVELERYTYRQTFRFFELDKRGLARGNYLEVRAVTFGPGGERTEEFLKGPVNRLDRMRLTEEDFRDLREVQPFVLTKDTLWFYKITYEGQERLDDQLCHVYRIKPRQVLEGQRLLDGRVWIDQETLQVVQAGGLPVPQYNRLENANLFPHFVTVYEPVDGKFWFPVKTFAEDTLAFPTGLQRVRYEIDFEEYKRFTAESEIRFDEEDPPQPE